MTLSLLSKGCQQALKELTCPLNAPTGQWKSLSQEQKCRFSLMATGSGQPRTGEPGATCRSTDLCKNGPEQQGTENLKRQPLRSPPPWPLRILNICTLRSKSKTGNKQTEASTEGTVSQGSRAPGHQFQAEAAPREAPFACSGL